MKAKSIWAISIIIAVAALLIAIVAAAVINNQKTSAPESQSGKSQQVNYNPPKACDILPLATAQKVDAGLAANDAPSSDASSDAILVSNCNYYALSTKTSVGLLVRGAKNATGADSNADQFKTVPMGAQAVDGYGDKAYWDPTFGQLNILKSNNWYILSNGPVMPKDRTLDAAKKLADVLIDKL